MFISKKQQQKIFSLLIVSLLTFGYSLFDQARASSQTQVFVFDVGQGLSQFIKTKEGVDILIDTGPNNDVVTHLRRVMGMWDKSIDILVLTHAHFDHIGGTLEVLKEFEVGRVIVTQAKNDSLVMQYILDELALRAIPIEYADQYKKYEIDNDTSYELLFPTLQAPTVVENPNNWSVISKFVDEDFSMLFPGDAEIEEEGFLVQQVQDLDVDVVVAPHHGSKTSSTEEFLKATTPDLIIISSGKNNEYGHPHKQALERMKAIGAVIKRTDEEGTVIIQTKLQSLNTKR
ncbi:MBL fold metallo-hydrolase [Candidatus Falkowbacteria bacterium]|nr:MBL fold metallo-hydrolase [Candidatus Falkowbacteria bacterium]